MKLRHFYLLMLLSVAFCSCNEKPENPNVPDAYIDITIDPNSTFYQELNTVGGWMYLTAREPSRGLIVYRWQQNEFLAYDRIPPNYPDSCGSYTRLVVNFPWVVDSCIMYKYSILDGSLTGNDGYPLVQYWTNYDGVNLRIYNN